jgi:hypothetical protein
MICAETWNEIYGREQWEVLWGYIRHLLCLESLKRAAGLYKIRFIQKSGYRKVGQHKVARQGAFSFSVPILMILFEFHRLGTLFMMIFQVLSSFTSDSSLLLLSSANVSLKLASCAYCGRCRSTNIGIETYVLAIYQVMHCL